MEDHINTTVPWIVAYGVVAVGTIVCNLFFLFVFFKSDRLRRMRSKLFLIGLTVADLIVGAVAIPMFMAILGPVGELVNSSDFHLLYTLIEIMSSFASLFLLTVIALERVFSVFWPYKHRALSKTPYYMALFISWFLAVLLMILKLLQRYSWITFEEFVYTMYPFMMAVLIVIILSYFLMWRKFKASRMEGLHQRRDEQERNLAKTLAILTGIFLITWLPFFVLNGFVGISIINGHDINIPVSHVVHRLIHAAKLLHYSNSLANPVVYSFRFPEVRRTLARFFSARKQIVSPAVLHLTVRAGEPAAQ